MIRKKRDFRAGINFSRDRNPVPWKNVLPVGKKTAPPSLISMLLQFLTGNFSNCFIEQLCAIYAQMDMDIFAVQRIISERGREVCIFLITRFLIPRLRTRFHLYLSRRRRCLRLLFCCYFYTFSPFNTRKEGALSGEIYRAVLINVEEHFCIFNREIG